MTADTHNLPAALVEAAAVAWDNILERAQQPLAGQLVAAAGGDAWQQLSRVLACSPFVAELGRRQPDLLLDLLEGGMLWQSLPESAFRDGLRQQMSVEGAELGVVLRRYRQRHMLRIVWRDFCRLADTRETVRDTSLLAEACIAQALASSQAELERRFGVPRSRDSGERQELIVLAMGKLGARELNVSSDIDLIFAYPDAGESDGERKSLGNEEFFSLVSHTAGGYCFYRDARFRRLLRHRYNDVPTDGGGRFFYIRDGEEVWTPSWMPTQVRRSMRRVRCRPSSSIWPSTSTTAWQPPIWSPPCTRPEGRPSRPSRSSTSSAAVLWRTAARAWPCA